MKGSDNKIEYNKKIHLVLYFIQQDGFYISQRINYTLRIKLINSSLVLA